MPPPPPPEAGPSTAAGPSVVRRKLAPPPPPRPRPTVPARAGRTLPTKVLQGAGTRRTDSTRPGFGRDTIFVTRNVPLGGLIRRASSLVNDEGYTQLTLYALGAAIPQAFLLLHAVLDILPYPVGPKGMWYELTTTTVECTDEVQAEADDEEDEFAGLGALEAAPITLSTRTKPAVHITIHIAAKTKSVPILGGYADGIVEPSAPDRRYKEQKPGTKARPNAKLRQRRIVAQRREAEAAAAAGAQMAVDNEEEAMNYV
ncbi:uncharacterized protein LOC62_05G006751 [Vanrija pseudolonga]|uniref:Uncharacterized protein n=1 Tax=Vanrija pseudolonga TaxID=143232 RepID=A0AAF0YGS1_9TREE|nr:hypothetical protein LOC62_05G006751 [Vanrija pseudolonga]